MTTSKEQTMLQTTKAEQTELRNSKAELTTSAELMRQETSRPPQRIRWIERLPWPGKADNTAAESTERLKTVFVAVTKFRDDLHGHDITDRVFRDGLHGCERTGREFRGDLHGQDVADMRVRERSLPPLELLQRSPPTLGILYWSPLSQGKYVQPRQTKLQIPSLEEQKMVEGPLRPMRVLRLLGQRALRPWGLMADPPHSSARYWSSGQNGTHQWCLKWFWLHTPHHESYKSNQIFNSF